MLGPMVNPSFPKKQLVGVFSLELARLYGYLYQKTDKQFTILHSLDGYDEISLTGNFKMITNAGEQLLSPEDLGLKTLKAETLSGGNTIESSAKIFESVLKNKATIEQHQAVIANAGMALYCANQKLSLLEAVSKADESIKSGKALEAFKKLINKRTVIANN